MAGISGRLLGVAGCWLRYAHDTPAMPSMTPSVALMPPSLMGKLALFSSSTALTSCRRVQRKGCKGNGS